VATGEYHLPGALLVAEHSVLQSPLQPVGRRRSARARVN
jgi:hypothetical protein